MSQQRAPIFDSLVRYAQRRIGSLHTPGSTGAAMPAELLSLFTELGLACDLPSMDATDSVFQSRGCIAEAQALCAQLYDVAQSFFLVNGSTIGVQAMLLATLRPGDKVLLSRYFHISAFSALVLSGAVPVYLRPMWSDAAGPIPPAAEDVAAALSEHPDIRAVFLTHPTYYGIGRPLAPIATLCRSRRIPLLVDEAHGAHLPFMPAGQLGSAVAAGADVVVQSVHKTVGSLVGTAQLHRCHGSLVDGGRLQGALNLLQSSRPSYLLLASLDLSRRWLAQQGSADFARAVHRANDLRTELDSIAALHVLDPGRYRELKGCQADPLRLTIDVAGLGLTGWEVQLILSQRFQLEDEFCDHRNVCFVLGEPDRPESYKRLVAAFSALAQTATPCQPIAPVVATLSPPTVALTPREAASRATSRSALQAAVGRICGEKITVFPPGIPLICPGETMTQEVASMCDQLAFRNFTVLAEDPSLQTIMVIDD